MEHIDEGTIHAWLDDALASDESARVEQHVRECAECAAAVAEARGLIAASTRILSALDDVPGGVVPRRVEDEGAPVAAGAPAKAVDVSGQQAKGAGAAPARRRRAWWQRPQFAAAAGIAFVAVALSVVWQRSPQRTVADFARESASEPAAAPAIAPSAAPATDAPTGAAPPAASQVVPNASPESAPNAVAGAAAATGAAPAAERESKELARPLADVSAEAPARSQSEGARAKRAAANEPLADASSRARSAADLASSNAPSPSAARAAAPAAPSIASQKAAPPALPAPAAVAQQAPTDSVAARRKLALNADNITRAEQARVRGERDVQVQAVVTTGASAATEARRDFTSAAGIVGCYRLQRRVPALDAGVPELVELQGTERGVLDGDVLRVARLIGVDPTSGTEWRWSLSNRGDVSLVRVQGAAYARFPLALRVAAQTGESSIATRVTCPAR